jgi:uncharacterized membrane protein YedE/YeeE
MNWSRRWPPVFTGILIGFSMLLSWIVSGRGIGASGSLTRIIASIQHWIAPTMTAKSEYFTPYFAHGANPLNDYLLYLMVGLLIGAHVAGRLAGEVRLEIQRGPRISNGGRLLLALGGGVLTGFASRLARGCASGEGLVGGAELSVGAWIFLLCTFAGGFATAYFVRKQWI